MNYNTRIRFLPSTISRRTTRVVTWQFRLLAQEPQTLSLKFSPVWVCSTSEPASIRIKQSWKRQTARALLLIWLPSDMEPMPYITMAVTFTAVSMPFPWWDLILSPARNWWTFRVIRQTEASNQTYVPPWPWSQSSRNPLPDELWSCGRNH